MVCDLPLLFADGQPTSLERMTGEQLERFLPFMIQSCPGYDPGGGPPQWWPIDLAFRWPPGALPIAAARSLVGANRRRALLKDLVRRCYLYHGVEYLLRLCDRLTYMWPDHVAIRDGSAGFVHILHKKSDTLIFAIRKINQVYDQVMACAHKALKDRPVDIYLCAGCDDEFNDYGSFRAHEETCLSLIHI